MIEMPNMSVNRASEWHVVSAKRNGAVKGTRFVIVSLMRLTLQPNGKLARGSEPMSYIVHLPHNASAILDLVAGQGWHLTIRHDGRITNRGMFANKDDILRLLEDEYVQSPR